MELTAASSSFLFLFILFVYFGVLMCDGGNRKNEGDQRMRKRDGITWLLSVCFFS